MIARNTALCILLLAVMSCASQPALVTDTTCGVRSEEPPLAIYFVVDRNCDADWVVGMFKQNDPAGLASRAKSMGIDVNVAQRIRNTANFEEARRLAQEIVGAQFGKHDSEIRAAQSEMQSLWGGLIQLFSKVVVETTQSEWAHSSYFCVVSAIHPGISDWFGNRVAIRFDRSPEFKRRILAHELILSDAFQLLRRRHNVEDIADWKVWAFSEITAVLILDDPRLRPFWLSFPKAGEYFRQSNYPQLAELEAELKAIYDDKSSYLDYQEQAVRILKAYDQTRLVSSAITNRCSCRLRRSPGSKMCRRCGSCVSDSAAQLNSMLCALICVYLCWNTANFVSATIESSAKR